MVVPPNKNYSSGKGCPMRMLGLRPSATKEDVMREWRRQMREVHPDKCSAVDAKERTQQLVEVKERALKVLEERAERQNRWPEETSWRREERQVFFGASDFLILALAIFAILARDF